MTSSAPKSEPLRVLYWRSEGLGDLVDVDLIGGYLGLESHESLRPYLDVLVQDGCLVRDGEWYALSPRGLAEGEAQLATAFTDLIHPVVNECDDECWCHTSAAEAEACARARTPRPTARETEAGKATA
jgi:hypothetical protein